MLSDKKAGPFKVEIACIKVVNPPGQAPQKATTSPGQSPATRPDVQPKLSAFIVDGVNNQDWDRATRVLKSIFLDSGRFTVDVTTCPPGHLPISGRRGNPTSPGTTWWYLSHHAMGRAALNPSY